MPKLSSDEAKRRQRKREKIYYAEHREEVKKRCCAYSKKYYREHIEQKKQYNREYGKRYYAEHKKERNEYSKRYRARTLYNLTPQDFELMLQRQGGKCAICKEVMDRPHIDHCHRTGKVRGILCDFCNHGLGNFRDSIDRLFAAAVYLGVVSS